MWISSDFKTKAGPFKTGARTIRKWVRLTVSAADELDGLVPWVRVSYASSASE